MTKRARKKLNRKLREKEYITNLVDFLYTNVLGKGHQLDFDKLAKNKKLHSKTVKIVIDRLVSKQALENK
jgi:hypothetical protein